MIKLSAILKEIKNINPEYLAMSDKERYSYLLGISKEVNTKVYSKKYLSDPDGDTIMYAKELGRKYKIPFNDILSVMRPSGTIRRPVWDSTGKIIPYEKLYGR